MRHGSLFSGIGGFDLAAQWMGWQNIFHCEINAFCQKVLKYYWPKAISYHDIKLTDFTIFRGAIDIITGGFPCQPYSAAGKRLGKDDQRHLWPEMLRAIREIRPQWVVGENVYGLLNWNGGLVFDEVQADLEAAGYEVIPYILPACGAGAPHRRDRIWFVAYARSTGAWDKSGSTDNQEWGSCKNRTEGLRQTYGPIGSGGIDPAGTHDAFPHADQLHGDIPGLRTGEISQLETPEVWRDHAADTGSVPPQERTSLRNTPDQEKEGTGLDNRTERHGHTGTDPDTTGVGFQGRCNSGELRDAWQRGEQRLKNMGLVPAADWQNFPTQSPLCGGNDGFSDDLDGITFSKWRSESIKAYGNAVVPQIPYMIFKAIEELKCQIYT